MVAALIILGPTIPIGALEHWSIGTKNSISSYESILIISESVVVFGIRCSTVRCLSCWYTYEKCYYRRMGRRSAVKISDIFYMIVKVLES